MFINRFAYRYRSSAPPALSRAIGELLKKLRQSSGRRFDLDRQRASCSRKET